MLFACNLVVWLELTHRVWSWLSLSCVLALAAVVVVRLHSGRVCPVIVSHYRNTCIRGDVYKMGDPLLAVDRAQDMPQCRRQLPIDHLHRCLDNRAINIPLRCLQREASKRRPSPRHAHNIHLHASRFRGRHGHHSRAQTRVSLKSKPAAVCMRCHATTTRVAIPIVSLEDFYTKHSIPSYRARVQPRRETIDIKFRCVL